MNQPKQYPIEEALKAQNALRAAAGLEPELFPVRAFVGMIGDEVQRLREQGRNDEEIAALIRRSSAIDLTAREIGEYYAAPDERHPHEY